MSKDNLQLQLQERAEVGKALKKLRTAGNVPAIIQGAGKDTKNVSANYKELAKVYAQAGQRHPIELHIGSGKQLAMIKEVEVLPVRHDILHVVFQAIKANEKVTVELPIEFIEGEIPAEKNGLMILKTLEQVEVEALPNDMPDSILIDPTSLEEAGQKLRVEDIKVPANVAILTDPETVVAVIEEPRVQEEEPDQPDGDGEDAEEVPSDHGDKADDNVGEAGADKKD